jgi:hypothetical protein
MEEEQLRARCISDEFELCLSPHTRPPTPVRKKPPEQTKQATANASLPKIQFRSVSDDNKIPESSLLINIGSLVIPSSLTYPEKVAVTQQQLLREKRRRSSPSGPLSFPEDDVRVIAKRRRVSRNRALGTEDFNQILTRIGDWGRD